MPTTKTPKQRRPQNRVAVQRTLGAAPAAGLLRRWARVAATAACEITVRVVGAPESRRLNSRYRNKQRPTNVLSFRYRARPLEGDIVLCHPVIAKEARAQGKALAAHYAHLVVHGVLHLRGHDHLRKANAARMERTEIRLLRRLGFGDPYTVK